MSIPIQDSDGQVWEISANAAGNITTTSVSGSPIIVTLYLLDPSNQLWQVGVTTAGNLTTTPASALDQPQFRFIGLGSTPNYNLFINTLGLLQTGIGGAFGAWVPNGYGAGTDNRVVGGGGGFMAYPQPPTGPKATWNPPENNGQFGAQELVYSNGIGTYFNIINPGRSPNS